MSSSCEIYTHIEKSVDFTLFDVKWIPSSCRLVVLGSHPRGSGVWQIYEMSRGQLQLIHQVMYCLKYENYAYLIEVMN